MLWAVLQTRDHLRNWSALVADLIHDCEQWELGQQPLFPEEAVHLGRGMWSLQLLSIQHLLLQFLNRLSCPGEGFSYLTVSSPIAATDKISHPAAPQESGCRHLALAESPRKSNHFHEVQADDSGLGVVSTTEALAEAVL